MTCLKYRVHQKKLLVWDVNKSSFKNYITQIVVFIVDTLIEPILVVFHNPTDHFGKDGSNFQGYRFFWSFKSLEKVYWVLCPREKNYMGKELSNAVVIQCHPASYCEVCSI